jgi:hypothetical protein
MSERARLPSGRPRRNGDPVRPDEVYTGGAIDRMLTCPSCLTIFRLQGSLQAHRPCTECAGAHLVPADPRVEEVVARNDDLRRQAQRDYERRLGEHQVALVRRRSTPLYRFSHSPWSWLGAAVSFGIALPLLLAAGPHAAASAQVATGRAFMIASGTILYVALLGVLRSLPKAPRPPDPDGSANPYPLNTGLGRYVAIQTRAADSLGHFLAPGDAMAALAAWDRRAVEQQQAEIAAQQASYQRNVQLMMLVTMFNVGDIARHQHRPGGQ